jgi:hypothetical protein
MRAITKFLAGGAAIASFAIAAPAAAQYYPGYGSPYGYGYGYGNGGVVGAIINGMLGGGYGNYGYGNNGINSQAVVNQCANAVQARLSGAGYGGYGGYGYSPYAYGGRVLGISRVEPRSSGGLTVRGVASSGRYAAYGSQVDLVWKCRTDYRGMIVGLDVNPAQPNYGYNYTPYNNYNYDYSQYGYRRY